MKLKLTEVLGIGEAMNRLEQSGIQFTVKGTLRWARTRKAVFEHVDLFTESIRKIYQAGEPTQEAAMKAQQEAFVAIDGDEVEIHLPQPIPEEAILEIKCSGPAEHAAMMKLCQLVFAVPPEGEPDR
jgi:hypothetical protein